jgi:hypothetical protein
VEFSEYVAARRTSLVRSAVLLGCPEADAEDVVQTALLKTFRSWRRVSRADRPDAYVYRILVNTLRDARGRRWRGERPTADAPDQGLDTDLTTGLAVRRALAAMSKEHREVLVLRYYAVPARPFVEPQRRSHSLVLAATVAVCLVAVGGLLAWRAYNPSPVDRPQGLTRVPSLVGYPTAGAVNLLRASGLDPRVRKETSCQDAGRAIRTRPLAGTRVQRDAIVVLVAATDAGLRCPYSSLNVARSEAWQLVDLARGLAGPRFAQQVRLSVNDQPPASVSAAEATDSAKWPACDDSEPSCAGTALQVINAALQQALSSDRFLVQPQLFVHPTSNDGSSFTFHIGNGEVGTPVFARWSVSEEVDASGDVRSVRLDFHGSRDSQPTKVAPTPAVVGKDPTGVGRRFVDFALGRADEFPEDTPVSLYLGNVHRRTLTAQLALDRSAWRTCVTYAGQSCPKSAPATIAAYEEGSGRPVRLGGPGLPLSSGCLAEAGPPPSHTGGTHQVVIVPSGRTSCLTDFRIDLWVNDVSQVVAVNELLAEPCRPLICAHAG